MANLLGPSGWLTGADTQSYSRDWLDRYGVTPLGVARPASTAEVAAVVTLCRAAGVPVVPQGGNTGLCGAAVATQPGTVILSLSRMAQIGAVNADSATVTVGAGVVLAELHRKLDGSGLIFPLHLGAEGSARIGGLIGTNAGGSHAFRHGMMADLVLGLEVVLPDGTIWNGLREVQKDNAGYALRRLFCGAEGTLGIVTRAVLRLAPEPRHRATALLALPDFGALVRLGTLLRAEAAEFLTGLEFFCDFGLGLALRHVAGLGFPLTSRAPVYLLVELASGSGLVPLDDIFADVLTKGMEAGLVLDGALAASEAQRAAFWRLREEQPEGQRLEGPQIKHDIAVPPGRIADFIAQGAVLCQTALPGTRINPFGHLGDGNIHYNLSPPEAGFGNAAPALAQGLAQLAQAMGGSFAAEHGLGRSKIALADALRDPAERGLMRAIKAALDPAGLMNPGVVLGHEPADN
ncbi:FAD-binding oxidoreductase [Fuscibacter oryzae]|uniref:FAD-binding oxidoreductase n=1 Tax=Fuscibacter oryzae TaxID=2803939 RepID=A0A8J7SW33_9RHOB|nr:FAD-binding oxidoreductase [Fuscibacter oryzae]MBL4930152.1 FAD-binding oxidoreductase [Fuscibacter oryzae]